MAKSRYGWEDWESAFALTGRGTPYLHLERANSEGICHCTCPRALVAVPDQLECPWCGCGWLFSCALCGRAFTHAKPVLIDQPLAELVERDLLGRGWEHNPEFFAQATEYLASLLADVVPDTRYVYLDGAVLPLHARDVHFEGVFASHDFHTLPHAEDLERPGALAEVLADGAYWYDRKLPEPTE